MLIEVMVLGLVFLLESHLLLMMCLGWVHLMVYLMVIMVEKLYI